MKKNIIRTCSLFAALAMLSGCGNTTTGGAEISEGTTTGTIASVSEEQAETTTSAVVVSGGNRLFKSFRGGDLFSYG